MRLNDIKDKMFMKQIPSLKGLKYEHFNSNFPIRIISNVIFTSFSGAMDCLTDLLTLNCSTDAHPEIFCQLSQLCHHLRLLCIRFKGKIPDGLKDLIPS